MGMWYVASSHKDRATLPLSSRLDSGSGMENPASINFRTGRVIMIMETERSRGHRCFIYRVDHFFAVQPVVVFNHLKP